MPRSFLYLMLILIVTGCSSSHTNQRKYSNHSYCAQIAQTIQGDANQSDLTRPTAINHARDVQEYANHGCQQPWNVDNTSDAD